MRLATLGCVAAYRRKSRLTIWSGGNTRSLDFFGYYIGANPTNPYGVALTADADHIDLYMQNNTAGSDSSTHTTWCGICAKQQIAFSQYTTCEVTINAVDRAGTLELYYGATAPAAGTNDPATHLIQAVPVVKGVQTISFDLSAVAVTAYPTLHGVVANTVHDLNWQITDWKFK